jgi:hypothetical protein
VARGLSLSLSLSVLAASAALAGCGAGSTPAIESTHTGSTSVTGSAHSLTVGGASTSVSHSAREPSGRRQPGGRPLTTEEMREYDVNEGHCHDDGGSVRDVGTIAAYCSFPARSNDFHLIESSHEKEPVGEEE